MPDDEIRKLKLPEPQLEELLVLPCYGPASAWHFNHHGSWDLRGCFDEYVGHTKASGTTVIDVGCASGFLRFEAEKRGASQALTSSPATIG